MAGGAQSRRNNKPSIKYPLGGDFFWLSDYDHEDYASSSFDNSNQRSKKTEAKSPDVLSTAELISAVGQLWDFATCPLSVLHPKTTLKQDNANLRKGNVFYYPAEEGKITASTSAKGQNLSVNFMITSHSSPLVKEQPNLDCLHVAKKISCFERCSESHMCYLLWRCMHLSSNMLNQPCKEGLSSVAISYDLRNRYGWMTEMRISKLKHLVNSTQINQKKINDCYSAGEITSPGSSCIPTHSTSPDSDLMTSNDDCNTEIAETPETSSGKSARDVMNTNTTITSVSPNYLLEPILDIEADDMTSITPISSLQADCCINCLPSGTNSYTQHQHNNEDDLHESKEGQQIQFVIEEKSEAVICSSTQHEPRYALAKQEHAIAGAFAGIFVSLCLHPVDTVKTVIQSCHTDQRSIHNISKSIISERGVLGLYRGIASNIASSAPISAIYTFTYESVKGALLPLFAKEYHSFAHCMAGGSASIATSFIFTPSERIKQQMQVGSHYHNCWNALFGIVRKGGFSSLYAGWGAVLCRNFYTYESLKPVMLSSLESNAQNTTILTLICGGLAGSTAALFTTPFDVVKTRLQTQIPGSGNHYDGVFNTLKEIARHEDLKGLYRGLTPRLAMYMTQGALFFASYESFKSLFALEVPKLNAEKIQNETKTKDALSKAS